MSHLACCSRGGGARLSRRRAKYEQRRCIGRRGAAIVGPYASQRYRGRCSKVERIGVVLRAGIMFMQDDETVTPGSVYFFDELDRETPLGTTSKRLNMTLTRDANTARRG